MKNTPKSPKRFPRITNANEAGKTTNSIWQSPKFSVEENSTDEVTAFVHSLPFLIPLRIRKRQSGTFAMLFASPNANLKSEIEKAYETTRYKSIPVATLFDRVLRKVVTKAMAEIYMRAKSSTDPYSKYMKGGRKEFVKAAQLRRKPDKKGREQRAIRMARSYEKLWPIVAKIRQSILNYKQDGKQDEEGLRNELERDFHAAWLPHVIAGHALKDLPEIPGYGRSTDTLVGLNWTTRQLTVGIIKCVEDERRFQPSLNATTILEEYLPLGRRLLEARRQ